MDMSESALHDIEALLRAHWLDCYSGVRRIGYAEKHSQFDS